MLCNSDKTTDEVRETWLLTKINILISSLSSDEIYALLDSIESDEEEDIENLMNDSNTEFVDKSIFKNKDSNMQVDEEPETASNDAHSNLIPTHLPIQVVVRQDVPEEASSDYEPLITLAKQKEPVWKWRKRFAKTPLQPCFLKEEGVVNMQTKNVTPFEAFSKCIGLPGLLSMMKIESERYAAQNGIQFQISEEEFCAFLLCCCKRNLYQEMFGYLSCYVMVIKQPTRLEKHGF